MNLTLLNYRGHIRNWNVLCEELHVDKNLERKERERSILLKGFKKWGPAVADHMYGMFAFAVKDGDRITAVRDQFGMKPFYYYITEAGELLFGTYIREIMANTGFVKELNEDMLQIYLTLTYPGGEDTFFKGLKKLMPGHYLVYENRKLLVHRYWRPEFSPDRSKSLEEYADEIHETMKQIMSELDDGQEYAEAFLSSGVDSSYVLAMSKAQYSNSCGYEDERFDESAEAEKTAALLGRECRRYLVSPEEYFAAVPYVCENMEQPLGDASAIVYSLACKRAVTYTGLCYSGEGSDEFFGGYNMYRNAERYGDHLEEFYVGNSMIMNEDEKRRLLLNYHEGVLPIDTVRDLYDEMRDYDPLSKMIRVDMYLWLEGDIFLNVDKMSTVCGLEVRMPIADRRMFEIASHMPPEYKVSEEQNKAAFRMAAGKVLSEEISHRKKLGFIVPIRYWMADPRYNGAVCEKLFGETAGKFFDLGSLHELFDEYIGGNSDLWRKIWTIYVFIVWYEIYFCN